VVVEWGEGLVERLAERHLDIRLERVTGSDVRIATWRWADNADNADSEGDR
jgi:tRNA threonylcarbamoyladenosine biosynthesis protein TsaE